MVDVVRPPYPGVLPPEVIRVSPNHWTEPFWAAAAQHRLVVARCEHCGTRRMPPSPFCWKCSGQEISWEPHGGSGSLYSYTVIRHAVIPDVADALPIVAAVVTLDDADECRLVGDVIDCDPSEVRIGASVELVWYAAHDDVSLPCFRQVD